LAGAILVASVGSGRIQIDPERRNPRQPANHQCLIRPGGHSGGVRLHHDFGRRMQAVSAGL
jgi:hypothetical protein